jgi:uncharacterized caspase-like protein
MAHLPDPTRSRAVLIGSSRYLHLDDLPAVANNLTVFHDLLTDPDVGGFADTSCSTLLDAEDAFSVFDILQHAAREAEDTLLVYFAGHGLTGTNNELYLAMRNTRPHVPAITALPYEQLREAVLETRALKRVVILDCCFAGLAIQPMTSVRAAIMSQTPIEGTYILAATADNRTALAPEGVPHTAFTGTLLEVLHTG